MSLSLRLPRLLILATLLACGRAPTLEDAGTTVDAGTPPDAGLSVDGGTSPGDGGVDGGTAGAGPALSLSPFFGMTVNGTNAANAPQLSYGVQRFWDSPPFQWQTMQKAPCADLSCDGGFDVANLAAFDAYLGRLPDAGVREAIYTMARTPPFATAFPHDGSCGDTDSGLGACDRPSDLNEDGSGSNQTFRAWYAFFASHLMAQTALGHAHVRYWEIWNEPDTPKFWGNGDGGLGAFSPLVRMAEDMRCMLTGQGVVHNYPNPGAVTPCANAGLPALGIDPTALIVSPSYHALGQSLPLLQDFLYCTHASGAACNTGDAGAAAVDVINIHMKPGQGCVPNGATPANCTRTTTMEVVYSEYVSNVRAQLAAAELAKPLWDDESDYAEHSFPADAGAAVPYSSPDMIATWVPRFLLVGWSLGVSSQDWYTWDHLKDYPGAVKGWDAVQGWMVGATLLSPCASAGGSVYACDVLLEGVPREILWDTSQTCSGGTCATNPYSVPSQYATYDVLTGDAGVPVGACGGCSPHQVPLGLEPLLLSP